MTQATDDDTLATSQRVWRFKYELDWPELLDRVEDLVRAPPGTTYDEFVEIVEAVAIVTGSRHGTDLAPLVPFLDRDLAMLEQKAAAGQLGWSRMPLVDEVGVFVAMGAPGTEQMPARAATCLPSIGTSRNDDHVYCHWNRGLAALALGVPAIYRPISGHEMHARLRFVPGARFELNIQGLLGHLAAAVEQRAALADCEPAWHDLLLNFRVLQRANMLSSASLVWIAWILHHCLAGQPIASTADYLQASVAGVVSAEAGSVRSS